MVPANFCGVNAPPVANFELPTCHQLACKNLENLIVESWDPAQAMPIVFPPPWLPKQQLGMDSGFRASGNIAHLWASLSFPRGFFDI